MITVIIPVHNILKRKLPGHDEAENMKRVYYSLLSIANAKRPPRVIIPDGSTRKNFDRLTNYTQQFPNVRHIHLPQRSGEMNLSKLWNQGMMLAESEYLLCTGIDFMYAPDYFDTLAKLADPSKMIISEVLMCPTEWVPSDERINEWSMPDANPNVAGDDANGVQLFSREWFANSGGYDERIEMWGAMDNQMVKRAKNYGMEIEWLRDRQVYHIWHPAEKFSNHRSNAQFNRNQKILKDTRGFKVFND